MANHELYTSGFPTAHFSPPWSHAPITEPLTPTQELCDLACEINGIEKPIRSKSLTLSDLNETIKRLKMHQHIPEQVVVHPNHYAAMVKLTNLK